MTPRLALVVLAVEHLAAHLLAGRTGAVAALPVAGVLAAVSCPLALVVAGKLFGTLDLFHSRAAPATLLCQLQTLRTVSTMASKLILIHCQS